MGMRTIAEVVGAPSFDLLLLLGTSAQERMSHKWRKTVSGRIAIDNLLGLYRAIDRFCLQHPE